MSIGHHQTLCTFRRLEKPIKSLRVVANFGQERDWQRKTHIVACRTKVTNTVAASWAARASGVPVHWDDSMNGCVDRMGVVARNCDANKGSSCESYVRNNNFKELPQTRRTRVSRGNLVVSFEIVPIAVVVVGR